MFRQIFISLLFPIIIVLAILQFSHGFAFSEESNIVTGEEPKTILVFPTQGLDKTAIDVLTSEEIPSDSYVISEKEGKPVAIFSKGGSDEIPVVETLKSIKEPANIDKNINYLIVSMKKLMGALRGYKIEQVELWISAMAESGNVTKFLISAKGEGGIKIVLKPR